MKNRFKVGVLCSNSWCLDTAMKAVSKAVRNNAFELAPFHHPYFIAERREFQHWRNEFMSKHVETLDIVVISLSFGSRDGITYHISNLLWELQQKGKSILIMVNDETEQENELVDQELFDHQRELAGVQCGENLVAISYGSEPSQQQNYFLQKFFHAKCAHPNFHDAVIHSLRRTKSYDCRLFDVPNLAKPVERTRSLCNVRLAK